MPWEPCSGAGIVIHGFVANGTKQMSCLAGDTLQIFHKNGEWYHVKNDLTLMEGIVPANCLTFVDPEKANQNHFFAHPDNLLIFEARKTIRVALESIRSHLGNSPQKISNLTDGITEIVTILDRLTNPMIEFDAPVYHQKLAKAVDVLRSTSDLHKTQRNIFDSQSTITTWGREMFAKSFMNRTKPQDYVILHLSVTATQLKKPVHCRFAIYQKMRATWITCPVSAILSPEEPDVDLIFDELEKRDMKETLYLVIYIYEFSKKGQDSDFDEREFLALSVSELPSCKSDLVYNSLHQDMADKPVKVFTVQANSFNTNSMKHMFNFHQHFAGASMSGVDTIIVQPTFNIKFSPYFGNAEQIVNKLELPMPNIVQPMFLPQMISSTLQRNTVSVYLSAVSQHSKRKKSRILAHLYDSSSKEFLPNVENPNTKYLSAPYWVSASFRGATNDLGICEVFSVDLNTADQSLKNLYIVVEVQRISDRSTYTSSYGVIGLASDLGTITSNIEAAIKLTDWPKGKKFTADQVDLAEPEKEVGQVKFALKFASTVFTPYERLYKLLSWKQYPDELELSLKEFNNCGMGEWSKFIRQVLLELCLLIATKPDVANLAFSQFQKIFSDILARGSADYLVVFDEFINTQFDAETPTNFHDDLSGLFEIMMPLLLSVVDKDDTTGEFRSFLKSAPYYMQLVLRSFAIAKKNRAPSQEAVTQFQGQVRQLFDKMCEMMKEIPDESDNYRKGLAFTNQQLIMQHFVGNVKPLIYLLPVSEIDDLIIRFLNSVRNVPTDKKQMPIDKSKMKIILQLSSTEFWTATESRAKLQPHFKQILMDSLKLPHCVDLVIETLASLYFSVRDDFIVQFVPALRAAKPDRPSDLLPRILMIIAFNYPEEISADLMVFLMGQKGLSMPERLFVMTHYFNCNHALVDQMKDKSIANDLLTAFIRSAIGSGIMPKSLDNDLLNAIYPSNVDFSSFANLLLTMSPADRISSNFIGNLIFLFMLYKNEHIKRIIAALIEDDLAINKSVNMFRTTALSHLNKHQNEKARFPNLVTLFTNLNMKTEEGAAFAKEMSKLVRALRDIRQLESNVKNEDQLGESYVTLLDCAEKANDTSIMRECFEQLYQLHIKLKNFPEAANIMMRALTLIPVDFSKPPPLLIEKKKKPMTGIEMNIEILQKAVDLLSSDNYTPFALAFIDQIKKTCITPFHYVELLPNILKREAELYRKIASEDRPVSNYYMIGFYGNFDEYYRNREFIYRKPFYVSSKTIQDDFKSHFPQADCRADFPTQEQKDSMTEQYIQAVPVKPTFPDEVEDPFWVSNSRLPQYVIAFEAEKHPCIFRYEKSTQIKDKSFANEFEGISLTQYYFFSKDPMPSLLTRCDIDTARTITRKLTPVQNAVIAMNRKNQDLSAGEFVASRIKAKGEQASTSTFTMSLNGTINADVNGGSMMYVNAFLTDSYIGRHPEEKTNINKLRIALRDQVTILEEGVTVHEFVVAPQFKNLHGNIVDGLTKMKNALKPYIDQIE